jgi:uncharacterized spore protein YtfJ
MERVEVFLEMFSKSFDRLTGGDAVVAKPISIGKRHVLPLCELKFAWGAGGGEGEGTDNASSKGRDRGTGGAGGGGAKANPVAVLIIEDGKVRLESLGT